jgi:hypothetical protein
MIVRVPRQRQWGLEPYMVTGVEDERKWSTVIRQ